MSDEKADLKVLAKLCVQMMCTAEWVTFLFVVRDSFGSQILSVFVLKSGKTVKFCLMGCVVWL